MKNTVIDTKNGIPITIADVAEVRIGAITRYGAVSKDGQGESVTGLVLSLRGANARQTIAGIEAKFAEISKSFPKGVEAKVFYNRGDLVGKAVGTVPPRSIAARALYARLRGVWRTAGRRDGRRSLRTWQGRRRR